MAKGTRDFTANTSKLKQSIAQATEPIKETRATIKDVSDDYKETIDMSRIQEAVDIMAVAIKQKFATGKKPRKEYTKREAKQHLNEGTTSGRKGIKQPRVNMAFRLPVYEYIHIMAEYNEISLTRFVNDVLIEHMETHKTEYRRAKRRLSEMKQQEGQQANG